MYAQEVTRRLYNNLANLLFAQQTNAESLTFVFLRFQGNQVKHFYVHSYKACLLMLRELVTMFVICSGSESL